jgi:hypothetical protein
MAKVQSYTAVGAVLLTGLIFHGSFNSSSPPGPDKPREVSLASDDKNTPDEGPWTASCSYWAAIHTKELQPAQAPLPPLDLKLPLTNNETDATVTGAPGEKIDCGSNTWAIPESKNRKGLEIHAILATIPDPIHSHLALEFDRSIDAILQAAADNHYLASSYWLPWRGPSAPFTVTQPAATDKAAERKRMEQPGLIILKYSPAIDEKDAAATSFYRVIYLFLVGESPALGMDGKQLHNALAYEKYLHENHEVALSMESPGDSLAFIGPRSSGAATSLRQALISTDFKNQPKQIIGAGITSTEISQKELNANSDPSAAPIAAADPPITYLSFGEDTKFEEDTLVQAFGASGSDKEPTAILVEDNTVFGAANVRPEDLPPMAVPVPKNPQDTPKLKETPRLYIRFPREISLLRNAQIAQGLTSGSQVPSPYLSLSLKDPGADDTIPKFSSTQTPLSQEAQLMAIERQLQKGHIRRILIAASSMLDEIFLAHEFRRACPNATIFFYDGADLLVERDGDNVPYIGSITVTPHSLVAFDLPTEASRRVFPDSQSAAVYNAASYIFWWGTPPSKIPYPQASKSTTSQPLQPPALSLPHLADDFIRPDGIQQFFLMATTVGSDGYYPLGILAPCASDSAGILPNIRGLNRSICSSDMASVIIPPPDLSTWPSMFWYLLCAALISLSVTHAIALHSASYWSPLTRDLAIQKNDQPRRRAVYIHIGTSMLVSMSLVLAIPWLTLGWSRWHLWPAVTVSLILVSAGAALVTTLVKTAGYRFPQPEAEKYDQTRLYPWFNLAAVAVVVVVLVSMLWSCLNDQAKWGTSYVGLFFSYRCLHPISGVSPTVPILLLLFGWYLWAMFQTARLRFSTMNRPRLPNEVPSTAAYPLYVTDHSLENCQPPLSSCLFKNIDCLLITGELTRRFTGWGPRRLNWSLMALYIVLFFACTAGLNIQSLDHFLHSGAYLTAYEWLIAILFYPLVMIALTGWLRVLLIWSELKDGLLEPLERSPFRFAFSRLSEVDWVAMLGQSGLNIRWRDMARSTESLRQLMNNDEIKATAGSDWESLDDASNNLIRQIQYLQFSIVGIGPIPLPPKTVENQPDLPGKDTRRELGYIYGIERHYALFCEALLQHILIPYWNEKRTGFVNEVGPDSPGARHVADAPQESLSIRLAEEFLAIRYVALIRSVLVNIRHLMLFVSMAFVLTIVAWNSYPFQPHQQLDLCFTILMVCLSIGFIWVFAQMHRNPLLSRITSTTPNELGADFYIRLVTFGAVPVLAWLAYQFPEIGGSIFRLLQPSLQVAK